MNKYKVFRNKYNRLKHHAMLTYYHEKCNANRNNVKKLWQLINKKVCGKTSNKTNIIANIKINNIDYYSSNTICNLFGDYFANVGKDLAMKIPTPGQSIDKCINKIVRNPNTLYLFPTNSTEISWLVNHLPNKTSLGHDKINNLLLTKIATNILKPLEIMFNHSITNHTFPNGTKLAEVIPLFKGKETYLITKYRPVSLLITILKIL